MEFIVSFDVVTLMFLLLIAWQFFSKRQFPLTVTKYYGIILISAISFLCFDIAGAALVNHIDVFPVWLAYVVNYIYFAINLFLPSALCFYIFAAVYPESRVKRKWLLSSVIPLLVVFIVFVAGIPLNLIMTISKEYGYQRGALYILPYINIGLYAVFGICVCSRFRKVLPKEVKVSYTILIILIGIAVVLQYFVPNVLFIGTAVGLSLAIMFFTLTNPALMIDGITDLYNYKAFTLMLSNLLANKKQIRLAIVEIHGLRRVNNLYGNDAGNSVLHQIGDYLAEDKKAWVFRISSTRFVLIAKDRNTYLPFIGRVAEKRNAQWPVGKDSIEMSMNVCTITNAEKLETIENVMNVISVSMDDLSRSKAETFVFNVNSERMAEICKMTELESVIRRSIEEKKGFYMVYQPIYSIKNQRFNSAEALLRFCDEENGVLYPDTFLPVIERSGYMSHLDDLVIDLVFEDIKNHRFKDLGIDHLHINLSTVSFTNEIITKKVISKIQEYDIPSGFISLEITETAAINSRPTLLRCMEKLHEAGVSVSLDDFGTGYSNFARLIELPFDVIKLDRSLLQGPAVVFEKLIDALKLISKVIVSEGAETEEQVSFLKQNGIDGIQGYYYSKPLPVDEFKNFLEKAK